jgi:fatty-acyl-CoA synthase
LHGRVRTLADALEQLAGVEDRGFTFLDETLEPQQVSFAALYRRACRAAAHLRAAGITRRERVALILPHHSDFVLAFYGCVMAGLVPVPIYAPANLGVLNAYPENCRAILARSRARFVLTTGALRSALSEMGALPDGVHTFDIEWLRENAASGPRFRDRRICGHDLCFLQFTSGSTAQPRGVRVLHGNAIANARAITAGRLRCDPRVDRALGWLPLHHDMGLIGFVVAPVVAGFSSILLDTAAFVWGPGRWMQAVARHRATLTFGPNFAYRLITKRPKDLAALDLSCLRVVGCGAEPIDPDTIRAFARTYAACGLSPAAFTASYGLAESTLAAAMVEPGQGLQSLVIDRALAETRRIVRIAQRGPGALEVACCGRALPGHVLRIEGAHGEHLGEGRIGQIVVAGPSVTDGYYADAESSAACYRNGALYTGDLGFMWCGELYVCGRIKDVIIVRGRNLFPQSIELEVERIERVRAAGVAAFAVATGEGESFAVVLEAAGGDPDVLAQAVRDRLAGRLGVTPDAVVVVPPRTLPRTSSGKIRRQKTREAYALGRLSARARSSAQLTNSASLSTLSD